MKFEFYEHHSKHYFRLKARNGKIVLTSQRYTSKASCLKGVKAVQRFAQDDSRFERKKGKNGYHMFNLVASNNQVIGKSQMYKSKTACQNGIDSVGRIAMVSKVVEVER